MSRQRRAMTELLPIVDFPGPGRLLRLNGTGDGPPVLVTHGTFSNADTCLPLAQFLGQTAETVFVLEWRGRDGSPGAFDFHDLAEGEVTAALRLMPAPVHLVAHSGGGLAFCFALLSTSNRLWANSLTMLATQGTHLKDASRRDYLGVRAMDWYGQRRGYWPARRLGLGPCNESATLLAQWVRFNRQRKITTRKGADLFDAVSGFNLPVLALAGAGDTYIARPDGCEALARAFGPSAKYHLCSAETDGEDFTHARLIRSRAAATHVWPRITRFWNSL